jgi:hypothetical protein
LFSQHVLSEQVEAKGGKGAQRAENGKRQSGFIPPVAEGNKEIVGASGHKNGANDRRIGPCHGLLPQGVYRGGKIAEQTDQFHIYTFLKSAF